MLSTSRSAPTHWTPPRETPFRLLFCSILTYSLPGPGQWEYGPGRQRCGWPLPTALSSSSWTSRTPSKRDLGKQGTQAPSSYVLLASTSVKMVLSDPPCKCNRPRRIQRSLYSFMDSDPFGVHFPDGENDPQLQRGFWFYRVQ